MYSQVNLRAGIENERYGVYVYVRNLLDAGGVSYYSAVNGTPDYIATPAHHRCQPARQFLIC
jgi:outer membrane receptor protein involved in Fe transport